MKSIKNKLTEAIQNPGVILLDLTDNEAEFLIKLLDSGHELKETRETYNTLIGHYNSMLKDSELLTEISITKRVELIKMIKKFSGVVEDLDNVLKMMGE